MKKIIITCVLSICGTICMSLSAQTTTSFGVKLNGNLTDMKISKSLGGSSSFKPGASIGGFTTIQFSKNFALQPELLMNYTERKLKTDGERVKYKYASVEVPVYALGQFEAGNGKVFVGVGPHIGYGFSVDSRKENLPDDAPGANKLESCHWYMGAGVIAGYELRNGLIFHAGYQRGYDLRSSKRSNIDTQTISLGIGYRF